MRAKWSAPIRKYWKISEQMMVKYCDLAICDSVNIEKYIHECYDGKGIKGRNPKTTFIAYGADLTLSKLADDDEKLVNWYKEKGLTKKDYYLVVGRFVPENSFEVMIREFMKSKSKKNFAIITNVNEKFLNELEENLHFKSDKRIKFVGTVYDQELLKKIRENAYAYFHGHTVGGTNPSLIEALGSTDLNLLIDVSFNKEVAEDCALYWSRKPGSLAKLIDKADQMSADEIAEMGRRAKKRVAEEYTWDKICGQYRRSFLIENNLYYKVGFYFEDIEMLPRLFLANPRVTYVDYPFYNYVIRENSIMTSQRSPEKIQMSLEIYSEWMQLFSELDDQLYKSYLYGILVKYYIATARQRKIYGWRVSGLDFSFAWKYSLNKKEKLKSVLFNCFPKQYVKMTNRRKGE